MSTIFERRYSLEKISNSALALLECFPEHKIFAFSGDLGSGKTTFIKAICKHLLVKDEVASPTFAIVSVYQSSQHGEINHIDCYRLKNIAEAMNIGMDDYLYNDQYCFIEWPALIEEILPDNFIAVSIKSNSDGTRSLIAKRICQNTNQK